MNFAIKYSISSRYIELVRFTQYDWWWHTVWISPMPIVLLQFTEQLPTSTIVGSLRAFHVYFCLDQWESHTFVWWLMTFRVNTDAYQSASERNMWLREKSISLSLSPDVDWNPRIMLRRTWNMINSRCRNMILIDKSFQYSLYVRDGFGSSVRATEQYNWRLRGDRSFFFHLFQCILMETSCLETSGLSLHVRFVRWVRVKSPTHCSIVFYSNFLHTKINMHSRN